MLHILLVQNKLPSREHEMVEQHQVYRNQTLCTLQDTNVQYSVCNFMHSHMLPSRDHFEQLRRLLRTSILGSVVSEIGV